MRVVVVLVLGACGGASTSVPPPTNVSTAKAVPDVAAAAPEVGAPPACEPWMPEWPEGQADRVAFQDPATELWGYKTKAGAVALPAQYEEGWSFWPGGFAAVHLPAKDVTEPRNPFAFIDPAGKPIALAFNFDNGPDYYQEGFFRITERGKLGFMNDRGQIVIAPQYDTAFAFCHGKARIEHAGQTFYIDTTGVRTSPPPEPAQ